MLIAGSAIMYVIAANGVVTHNNILHTALRYFFFIVSIF